MTQNTQMKEETTQLLVTKHRWEMLLQVAHYNPVAGHFWRDKILKSLMARFYWLSSYSNARRWCVTCHRGQLVNLKAESTVASSPIKHGPLWKNRCGIRSIIRPDCVRVVYKMQSPKLVPLPTVASSHAVWMSRDYESDPHLPESDILHVFPSTGRSAAQMI